MATLATIKRVAKLCKSSCAILLPRILNCFDHSTSCIRKKAGSMKQLGQAKRQKSKFTGLVTPSGFASRSWGKPPRPRWLTKTQTSTLEQ
ncbi:hypothetical protein SD80_014745 [Scytonema tolypothrichoides VB-61278]|nr:hypothetical protein SD80_014745 [Scytonema tolypothrichoides VB-61278]